MTVSRRPGPCIAFGLEEMPDFDVQEGREGVCSLRRARDVC